jgi:hypothetical protein
MAAEHGPRRRREVHRSGRGERPSFTPAGLLGALALAAFAIVCGLLLATVPGWWRLLVAVALFAGVAGGLAVLARR